MQDLIASSPIVQPSDDFHTTRGERSADWEDQIQEGRRLMELPQDSQERIAEGLELVNVLQNPVFDNDHEIHEAEQKAEIMVTFRRNPESAETIIFSRETSSLSSV